MENGHLGWHGDRVLLHVNLVKRQQEQSYEPEPAQTQHLRMMENSVLVQKVNRLHVLPQRTVQVIQSVIYDSFGLLSTFIERDTDFL